MKKKEVLLQKLQSLEDYKQLVEDDMAELTAKIAEITEQLETVGEDEEEEDDDEDEDFYEDFDNEEEDGRELDYWESDRLEMEHEDDDDDDDADVNHDAVIPNPDFDTAVARFAAQRVQQKICGTFEEAISFLDDMVGMEAIKEKLLRLQRYTLWKKHMKENGCDVTMLPTPNLTFMFMGDPGTGKTTLAQRMGEILYQLGLIETRTTYLFRREDLVGENYGAEEKNTRMALQLTQNGVFILDEAYQCFKGANDKRDPGYHILETMMAEFDAPGRCIILAGYKDEMQELSKVNSGFQSRIPRENYLEFRTPSEEILLEIVEKRLRKMAMRLSPKATTMLRASIHEQFRQHSRSFGNARQMRQMVDALVIEHANRVMRDTEGADSLIINSTDMRTCLQAQAEIQKTTRGRIGFA